MVFSSFKGNLKTNGWLLYWCQDITGGVFKVFGYYSLGLNRIVKQAKKRVDGVGRPGK